MHRERSIHFSAELSVTQILIREDFEVRVRTWTIAKKERLVVIVRKYPASRDSILTHFNISEEEFSGWESGKTRVTQPKKRAPRSYE